MQLLRRFSTEPHPLDSTIKKTKYINNHIYKMIFRKPRVDIWCYINSLIDFLAWKSIPNTENKQHEFAFATVMHVYDIILQICSYLKSLSFNEFISGRNILFTIASGQPQSHEWKSYFSAWLCLHLQTYFGNYVARISVNYRSRWKLTAVFHMQSHINFHVH